MSCNRKIAPKQIMCVDHWDLVDDSLKEAVRKLKRTPGPAYDQAVAAAIENVRTKLTTEQAKLAAEHEFEAYKSMMGFP